MTGPHLHLTTGVGTIEIELHEVVAPRTVAFVRELVAAEHVHGSAFYRSTTLGADGRQPLIQGGPMAPMFTGTTCPVPHIELLETVEATSQTGLTHRRGAVSLARDLLSTGHVLPELFICLDDYPELDAGGRTEPDEQGFPAFGIVTSGLDVVTSIAAGPCDGASPVASLAGQILTDPVSIISATIINSHPTHATESSS